MTTKEKLLQLRACEEAITWAGEKSIQEIWDTCHRGDWMLWLFVRTNHDDFQTLTLAKAHCANTVRHLMKDKRSTDAVDMAIKFGEGHATRDELRAAAAAAAAYAAADAAYAAAAAAYAAADAADAAADAYAAYAAYAAAAADADAAAADAAYAAAAADADAAADAAYAAAAADADAAAAAAYAAYADRQTALEKSRMQTADICRKYLPLPKF